MAIPSSPELDVNEAHKQRAESPRETVDSIVIAFILAFVFRAFIIEAFVIPTGSMASTLNGAHGTMICRNCGWEYTYGLTDPTIQHQRERATGRPDTGINDYTLAICPNCRTANRTIEINDARRNQESGDRILVLKWPYDLGAAGLGPDRWDVVVFKDPSDGVTNYIKRLAGMPEEALEIVDGDVYTVPLEKLSEEARQTLSDARHAKYLRRLEAELALHPRGPRFDPNVLPEDIQEQLATRKRIFRLPDERRGDLLEDRVAARMPAVLSELNDKLSIQRKTDHAQDDLWRVVYHHDYPPAERAEMQPYWFAGNALHWSVNPRTLRFDGLGSDFEAIRLIAHIDSLCAYNVIDPGTARPPDVMPVSDLRLRFVVDYRGGDGVLRARLIKRDDIFIGELAADGTVRLLHGTRGAPEDLKELGVTRLAEPLRPGRQIAFAMQNLDYRVELSVDGQTVLATSDEQYAPDVASLRTLAPGETAAPAIMARDLDVELAHVVVERDIYYLSVMSRSAVPLSYHPWGVQNHPIMLRAGEYYMLGDNSAQSKDSRLWDWVGDHLIARGDAYQLGTVPRDQLIGRAFFVYWPSGLRTNLIPFLRERGWIPNFGRMRWIR